LSSKFSLIVSQVKYKEYTDNKYAMQQSCHSMVYLPITLLKSLRIGILDEIRNEIWGTQVVAVAAKLKHFWFRWSITVSLLNC